MGAGAGTTGSSRRGLGWWEGPAQVIREPRGISPSTPGPGSLALFRQVHLHILIGETWGI